MPATTDTLTFPPPVSPNDDSTPALRDILALCRSTGARRLVFHPGTYHFHPDRATESYLFISNNDEGLKHIAFPLFDFTDFEIDGGGAAFLFHGLVLPFVALRCTRLTLRNFSIDWSRSFHSEADVVAATSAHVDVRIPAAFPYKVHHGQLRFVHENGRLTAIRNILEFDPKRRETAFRVYDNYGIGERCRAEALDSGIVRLHAAFSTPLPSPGNRLVITSEGRHCPALTLDGCAEVRLQDVTLHHSGGMGVIAQHCRNLTLERTHVLPPPDGTRIVSTTADATHFVNCAGHIVIADCRFEQQMDDPVNVHGIYARIAARSVAGLVEIELKHHQQFGIDPVRVGDRVEFVDGHTLLATHTATVTGVERINRRFTRLMFDRPLPETVRVGDAVGNLDWNPDLTIRGTTVRANRARGFLISTAGKVIVENNHFHTPGAAILIAGDANHWFESGAVRDIVIRRNRFDQCNYGVWGRATIDINPEIEPSHRSGVRYHRNIAIEDNVFVAFDRRILRGHCIDGVRVQGNRVEFSTAYPALGAGAPVFDLTECSNVDISGNELAPEFQTPLAP
jgi:hypothetical protein